MPKITGIDKTVCAWPKCGCIILKDMLCAKHCEYVPSFVCKSRDRLLGWIRQHHGCTACFGSGVDCQLCKGSGVKQL